MKLIYTGIKKNIERVLEDYRIVKNRRVINKEKIIEEITKEIYNYLSLNISKLVILKTEYIEALLDYYSVDSMKKGDNICVLFNKHKVAEAIAKNALSFNRKKVRKEIL